MDRTQLALWFARRHLIVWSVPLMSSRCSFKILSNSSVWYLVIEGAFPRTLNRASHDLIFMMRLTKKKRQKRIGCHPRNENSLWPLFPNFRISCTQVRGFFFILLFPIVCMWKLEVSSLPTLWHLCCRLS